MFNCNDPQETREYFFSSWDKYQQNESLLPLQQQIVDVILEHPEYQKMIGDRDSNLTQQFDVNVNQPNPFLHMGLHLAIREQLATNRPFGIASVHQDMMKKYNNPHEVEHAMMGVLGDYLWQVQQAGKI